LPIQPEFTGSVDIRILASLVSAREQQNHLRSSDGVIDSISGTKINAQLPNTIAAKLVIAEVTQFHAVDSSVNN
jgi:hypothetical protein